ncbi:MAG: hypothetical protein J1D88_07955 [Treponema sp.]|nr:hypothetical protein [Treponema sp.]
MKNIICFVSACLCTFVFASCATPLRTAVSTMPEAALDLGSLSRDQYIVVGTVAGEASVDVSSSDLKKDLEADLDEHSVGRSYKLKGDTGAYGFIGTAKRTMTIEDRVIALATYKMIEMARCNQADAVLYVNTAIDIKDKKRTNTVTAKVTGIAIKLKPDSSEMLSLPSEQETVVVEQPSTSIQAEDELGDAEPGPTYFFADAEDEPEA